MRMNQMRLAITVVCAAILSSIAVAAPQSYSGQGTVVRGTVLDQTFVLADTGPLPPEGGRLEAFVASANVKGVASGSVLHASTRGEGDHSNSEASIGNFSLTLPADTSVAADVISSSATATCGPPSPCGDAPDAFGDTRIVGLRINGVEQVVTGDPNQKIDLGQIGSIVINEQTFDGPSDITVNALHIIVLNPLDGTTLADMVVASSHADVTCETAARAR